MAIVVTGATGNVGRSRVAQLAGDIAAVAARAILTDELVDPRIRLTGASAHTHAELVEIIGSVLDRRLRYQEVPPEGVREHFIGIGFSAEFADCYTALLANTVDQPAVVTPDVENILGRPAESFAEWVADQRSLFTGYDGRRVGLIHRRPYRRDCRDRRHPAGDELPTVASSMAPTVFPIAERGFAPSSAGGVAAGAAAS
jgi:hypothetical protein